MDYCSLKCSSVWKVCFNISRYGTIERIMIKKQLLKTREVPKRCRQCSCKLVVGQAYLTKVRSRNTDHSWEFLALKPNTWAYHLDQFPILLSNPMFPSPFLSLDVQLHQKNLKSEYHQMLNFTENKKNWILNPKTCSRHRVIERVQNPLPFSTN